MKIVVLLFEKFTALDIIGPYEVLCRLPNARFCFTGAVKKDYQDGHGLQLTAVELLENVKEADILLIPGGKGIDDAVRDRSLIEWIKKIHRNTKWTVSVCSGTLLLAEAGILKGKKCTTHWKRMAQLRSYDVHPVQERYVHDGKIITSAGVSAGIDMALYLVSKIVNDEVARLIQLGIEYDPQPPFNCGSPRTAGPDLMERYFAVSKKNRHQ